MNFGEKIRSLREEKGLVIRELAAMLEVDTSTISKIENSLRHATKKQVQDLSKALDVAYGELEAYWAGSKVYDLLEEIEDYNTALSIAKDELNLKLKIDQNTNG